MNPVVVSLMSKKALPNFSRQKLILKKQSPHIFFGLGVVGSVTSTVLACRATLKLSDTLEEIESEISEVKKLKDDLEGGKKDQTPYDEIGKDTAFVYAKAGYKLVRLYAIPISVGAISIAALTGSHVALSRRNTALMAAYAAVSKAYDDYRARVAEAVGTDQELDLYHAKISCLEDAEGDEHPVVDSNRWSPYARFFDEASPHWEKNAELNRLWVQCQQNYANELLRARGHLFLNEVYDMLGIDRSQAGTVVGWVIGDKGDNFVDFGMYEAVNSRFINGWERSILLDFNVDGVIYDKI